MPRNKEDHTFDKLRPILLVLIQLKPHNLNPSFLYFSSLKSGVSIAYSPEGANSGNSAHAQELPLTAGTYLIRIGFWVPCYCNDQKSG